MSKEQFCIVEEPDRLSKAKSKFASLQGQRTDMLASLAGLKAHIRNIDREIKALDQAICMIESIGGP